MPVTGIYLVAVDVFAVDFSVGLIELIVTLLKIIPIINWVEATIGKVLTSVAVVP